METKSVQKQPLNASAITLLFGKHPRLRAESQQKMAVLQNSDVPQWYVDSMCKIYYLFPKANAPHPCGGCTPFAPRERPNAPHPRAFYQTCTLFPKEKTTQTGGLFSFINSLC